MASNRPGTRQGGRTWKRQRGKTRAMLAVRRRPDDCSCLSLLGTARGDTWWQVSEASWDRPRETGPGFRRESHSWPAIARRFGVNGVVRNLACTRDCVRARQLSAVAVVTISFLSRWELRGRCATKSRSSDPRTWKIFVRRSTSKPPRFYSGLKP